jgi:hypothetical protein
MKPMMNPAKLFKIKGAWDKFSQNHPKFVQFLGAMNNDGIKEGTIIEINVITAEGKNISSNLKITQSDIELFKELSEISKN